MSSQLNAIEKKLASTEDATTRNRLLITKATLALELHRLGSDITKLEEARTIFDRIALAESPDADTLARYKFLQTKLQAADEDFDAAITSLQNLIDSSTDLPEVDYLQAFLASYFIGNNQPEKALTLFENFSSPLSLQRRPFRFQYFIKRLKGAAFRTMRDYKNAEKFYVEALNITKANKNNYLRAVSLFDLGTLASRRERYATALNFYDSAEQLIDLSNEEVEQTMVKAAILIQIGRYYRFTKRTQDAFEKYNDAIALTTKYNLLGLKLRAKTDLAILYSTTGDYRNSIITNKEIIDQLTILDSKTSIAYIRNNIALLYVRLAEYQLARYHFNDALDQFLAVQELSSVCIVYLNLAETEFLSKNYGAAIEYNNKAKELAEQIKSRHKYALALTGLAKSHNRRNELDTATKLLSEAGAILDELEVEDFSWFYASIENLWLRGEIEQAKVIFDRAEEFTASEDPLWSKTLLYGLMADLYRKQKDYQSLTKIQEKQIKALSDFFSKINDQSIAHMLAEYDSERKSQQIRSLSYESAVMSQEIEKKNQLLYTALIGSLVSLFIIVTFMNIHRIKGLKRKQDILRRLSSAFENTNDAVCICDIDFQITDVNKTYENLTGFLRHEVIGKKILKATKFEKTGADFNYVLQQLKHEKYWKGELDTTHKNGSKIPTEVEITTVYNDKEQIDHYLGVFRDISERQRVENELRNLATHDSLTGLANRSLLHEMLDHACKEAQHGDTKPALLFIDIDDFKQINDAHGHILGDQLLKDASQRIAKTIQSKDLLARFGGDEFVILLEYQEPQHIAFLIAQQILSELTSPFVYNDNFFAVSASIGIAIYSENTKEADRLLAHADIALYRAKEAGKNQLCFFEDTMTNEVRDLFELENRMKYAIQQHQSFQLHYQAKIELETNKILGAEALIRWIDHDGSILYPDKFIPLAERRGLVDKIDAIVVELACKQIQLWRNSHIEPIKIAVNLSAAQFMNADSLINMLMYNLEKYKVPSYLLQLEITEGMLVHNTEDAIATMHRLKEAGFSLAIDDFGTGYSSLDYITKFPVDFLKIDRKFIWQMHESANNLTVIKAIIDLAHNLDMRVIAEGIETRDHLEKLLELGCEEGQGYYFQKPCPALEFSSLLTHGKSVLESNAGEQDEKAQNLI